MNSIKEKDVDPMHEAKWLIDFTVKKDPLQFAVDLLTCGTLELFYASLYEVKLLDT